MLEHTAAGCQLSDLSSVLGLLQLPSSRTEQRRQQKADLSRLAGSALDLADSSELTASPQ